MKQKLDSGISVVDGRIECMERKTICYGDIEFKEHQEDPKQR